MVIPFLARLIRVAQFQHRFAAWTHFQRTSFALTRFGRVHRHVARDRPALQGGVIVKRPLSGRRIGWLLLAPDGVREACGQSQNATEQKRVFQSMFCSHAGIAPDVCHGYKRNRIISGLSQPISDESSGDGLALIRPLGDLGR